MIFTKVRLRPFAGLADISLEFAPGLNTVLGENEAGKSTVFRALENGLLERTDLTPARLARFVAPYLPVGGGDTIAVELQFASDNGLYLLRRQWGATCGSQLTLPDGGLVSGDAEIAERVSDMLGVSAGTCRSILFTRQTVLPETLAALKDQDSETVRDLSDLLSATMQETDGVSVETLNARLLDEHEQFHSRWDRERDRPEGNRGINNPWKKSVGRILAAYYAMEEIREALREAVATEEQVDQLNAGLAELTEGKARLAEYVDVNRRVVNDANRRLVVEAKEQSLEEQLKRLRKDNEGWPLARKAVEDAEKNSALLTSRIEELKQEESDVKRYAEGQALRDLAKRVKVRQAELAEAREKLGNTPQVSREKLEDINEAASRLRELEVQLAAVKLRVSLTAKKELRIRATSGLEEPIELTLEANTSKTLEVDGRLAIEHDDWAIEVQASELDVTRLAEQASEAKRALEKALEEIGVASREEAVRLNEAYEQATAVFENAESNLAAELGEKTLEKLDGLLADDEADNKLRSLDEVVRELTKAEFGFEDLESALRENRKRLAELEAEYGDSDGLLETTAKRLGEKKDLEGEKEALAPLPDGVDDVATFLEEFAEKEEELRECDSEINDKWRELFGVNLPDESTEELQARLALAVERFDRASRQGQVIERIIEAVEEVEAEAETGDRYAGFRAEVERYVGQLTSQRYQSIQIEEGLPSGFVRGDGHVLGTQLLSTGTQDVLGLSIRLAMAGFFLNGRPGFLVMDDPLVDMDPSRQEQAAALLREYAEENGRQVIVFTCFPGHAEVLGGRRVGLG
jgi:exonuclease SbcC